MKAVLAVLAVLAVTLAAGCETGNRKDKVVTWSYMVPVAATNAPAK